MPTIDIDIDSSAKIISLESGMVMYLRLSSFERDVTSTFVFLGKPASLPSRASTIMSFHSIKLFSLYGQFARLGVVLNAGPGRPRSTTSDFLIG